MKLTACIITLKEKMPDAPELPAWLRAKASITLDNQITLHGIVIRDAIATNDVFVTYPKHPITSEQFEVSPAIQSKIEPEIIFAYQKAKYPWLTQHLAPLHSLTLEILSGLREYYDYAVDMYSGQRDVNDKVVKLMGSKKDWDQNDYEEIKAQVEPILQKIQDTIPD